MLLRGSWDVDVGTIWLMYESILEKSLENLSLNSQVHAWALCSKAATRRNRAGFGICVM